MLRTVREREQALHDRGNAFGLADDHPCKFSRDIILVVLPILNQLRIVHDSVDRVVDFVRHTAGQGADGFKLLRLAQAGPREGARQQPSSDKMTDVCSLNEGNHMNALARRQFLQFLAASPLLGLTEAGRLFAEETLHAMHLPEHLIKSPADALDVFDFHSVAKQVLPTSHYGYLATGTDGNETLAANREAFERTYLRPMRMVDTSNVSLDTELLGQAVSSPILLAPVGSQKAFHADGDFLGNGSTGRQVYAADKVKLKKGIYEGLHVLVVARHGDDEL